jgi:sec-independent protein translocase protein TatA
MSDLWIGSGQVFPVGFIIPGMQGHFEVLLVVFIVLLLFGGKRIPELARGLGRGIREFKHAKHALDEEARDLGAELDDTGPADETKTSRDAKTPRDAKTSADT